MAYPITIDDNTTIPIESASTPLSTNHINNHTETRSAVIALETKVGINNSAVTTTHDYKLNEVTGSDKTVGKTATQAISNKTITASTLNGVNLTNAGGTSNFLRADGTYATPVIGAGSNTNYIQDSGVANAYVATLIPALGAYAAGVIVEFRATNANTGASTVNVSGLGVKSIFKLNGSTALATSDIAAGQIVTLRYDGTNFQMLSPVANAPLTFVNSTYSLVASSNVILSSPTLIPIGTAFASSNYAKVKEIQVYFSGTINTDYTIKAANSGNQTTTRIYINNISRGNTVAVAAANVDQVVNETFRISAGDFVQIFTDVGSQFDTNYSIKNFNIKADKINDNTNGITIT